MDGPFHTYTKTPWLAPGYVPLTLLEPPNYQKYTQKSLQYDYLLRKTVSRNDEK